MISLSTLIWELLLCHFQSNTDHSGISKYDCPVTFYPVWPFSLSSSPPVKVHRKAFNCFLNPSQPWQLYHGTRAKGYIRGQEPPEQSEMKKRAGGGGGGGGGSTTHLVIPAWWMAKPYGSRSFSSWFWNTQSIKLHITSTPALYRSSKWALQQ